MTKTEEFNTKIHNILKILPVLTEISFSVTDNNETTYFGLRKDSEGISYPNNKTTAFEIGSVTKSFTGNLLAQLVVDGKVNLDDSISNFLSFELKGNPTITLKQLGMHTSGLPRMPANYDNRKNFIKENPFSNYNEDELITYLTKELQMECAPGEKVIYSNLGSGLLSYVISKIEGRPFSEIVEEKIFTTLEMRNSTFNIKNISTNMVKGLDKEGNFTSNWDGGILNGCLGIISTPQDLTKFAKATLNPNNKVANLQVSHTFLARPQVYSAIGWVLVNAGETDPIIKINGGTAGFSSSIFINRKKQKALVFCSNIQPDTYMELIEPLCAEIVK